MTKKTTKAASEAAAAADKARAEREQAEAARANAEQAAADAKAAEELAERERIEAEEAEAAAAVIGLITLLVAALALRSLKGRRSLQGASLALLALVVFQAWLGRQTVLEFNSGQSVTAHLATAMAFVGLQVWVLARSGYPERLSGIFEARGAVIAPIIAAGSIYALLLFGSNVTGTDTGLLYPDWPLMGGAAFPPVTELSTPHIVHRYATGIVGLILISALWIVRREPGSPRQTARLLTAAIGLFLVQCLIGALQIFTKLAPWTQTLHVALATRKRQITNLCHTPLLRYTYVCIY